MTTFNVTVGSKTSINPTFGMGSALAYYVNGQEAPTLQLQRGQIYTFNVNAQNHPLYFTTSHTGGQGFPDKIPNTPQTDASTITLDTTNLPSHFHYQCGAHQYMGSTIHVNGNETFSSSSSGATQWQSLGIAFWVLVGLAILFLIFAMTL